jgi:hypothetical protein
VHVMSEVAFNWSPNASMACSISAALCTGARSYGRSFVPGCRIEIAELSKHDPVSSPYLHWFQAITLADIGADDLANATALDQLAYDARMTSRPDCFEVGRRRYWPLRRFLEASDTFCVIPRS